MNRFYFYALSALFTVAISTSSFSASTAPMSEKASLHVTCKELMDLATYEEYFSQRLQFAEGESKSFTLRTHFHDSKATTIVSLTLLKASEEPFMEVRWSTYFNNKLVESHRDQLSVDGSTDVELRTQYYSYLFRNTCTLEKI